MAFTGTATQKSLGKNKVRITGLSLTAGNEGTIGVSGSSQTPDVELPSTFPTETDDSDLTLADLVTVQVTPSGAKSSTGIRNFGVVKSGDGEDFLITVAVDDSAEGGQLEILVTYEHSSVR